MVFSLQKYFPTVKFATEGNPIAFHTLDLLPVAVNYKQNFILLWGQRFSIFFSPNNRGTGAFIALLIYSCQMYSICTLVY